MKPSSTRVILGIGIVLIGSAVTLIAFSNSPRQKVEKSKSQVEESWEIQQEYVGRQDRTRYMEKAGLNQRIIANWGTEIAINVDRQIGNPSHPMYQLRPEIGLAKAEIYALDILSAIEAKGVTTKACDSCEIKNGIIVTFIHPKSNELQHILLPKQALMSLMLDYAQAAATIRNNRIRPTFKLQPYIAELSLLKKNNILLYGDENNIAELQQLLEKNGMMIQERYAGQK